MTDENKLKPLNDQFDELIKQFPPERYIILSPHRSLSPTEMQVFTLKSTVVPFSPDPEDGDMYFIDEPNDDNSDEGWIAFTGTALATISTFIGIRWMPNVAPFGRVDNGNDSMICEYRAGGYLVDLSGMTPVDKTHRTDLHETREDMFDSKMLTYRRKNWDVWVSRDGKNKKVRFNDASPEERTAFMNENVDKSIRALRRSLLEKCETKAQNRVIRHIAGIKQKYRPSVIREKRFVIMRLILDPKFAAGPERMMFLTEVARTVMTGYPTLHDGRQHAEIDSGSRNVTREITDGGEIAHAEPAIVVESVDADGQITINDAPVVHESADSTPIAATDDREPALDLKTFIQHAQTVKSKLIALDSARGATIYYDVLHELGGFEHANAIRGDRDMHECLDMLKTKYLAFKKLIANENAELSGDESETPEPQDESPSDDERKLSPPIDETDSPLPDMPALYDENDEAFTFVKMRISAFARMNEVQLVETVSEMGLMYDLKNDPIGIKSFCDDGRRECLEYAATKMFIAALEKEPFIALTKSWIADVKKSRKKSKAKTGGSK